MATEQDLINKFKDLAIPVGADFEELIHEAFVGANLADLVNSYDSRIATVENNLDATKGSIQANTDKLATKADDSKVVHSTITQLNSTDMNTVITSGFYQSTNGTNGIPSGDNWTIYQVIKSSDLNGIQLAYGTNKAILGIRSWNYTGGHLKFTSWVQFADDSKVVHNTGTEEIAGQKTFDTAPIDKATGNPYITKDGVPAVPSTLADTTKDANFTEKLQKSGIDVATTTDVTTAVNTAVSNSSKYIEASKNDESSAISESQASNLGNVYYWTEG